MGSSIGFTDAALYPYLLAMREELYTSQRAMERLQEARARWIQAFEDPEADIFAAVEAEQDVMGSVELFLTAHSRLSLYMFPAYDRPPARGRARALRACLGIPDRHPLGNRGARNAWMHIDEQIDKAVFERAFEFVEAYRLTRTGWAGGKPPRETLTTFNVDTLVLHVVGARYNLTHLSTQVDEVGHRLFKVIPDVEHRLDLRDATPAV